MFDQLSTLDLGSKAAVLTAALVGIAVGLQRVVKSWKSTDAETTLVTLLHKELERLSKQNTSLSEQFAENQQKLVEISNAFTDSLKDKRELEVKITELQEQLKETNVRLEQSSDENKRLSVQIHELNQEVGVLRSQMGGN